MRSSSSTGVSKRQTSSEQVSSTSTETRRISSLHLSEVFRSLPPIRSFVSEAGEDNSYDAAVSASSPAAFHFGKTKEIPNTRISSSVSSPLPSKLTTLSHEKVHTNSNVKNIRSSGKNAFFGQFFWGDLAVALAVGAMVGASIVAGFFTGILIVTDPSR